MTSQPIINESNSGDGYDVTLSWSKSTEGNEYTVFITNDANPDFLDSNSVTDESSLTLSGIAAGRYQDQLQVTDASGHKSPLSGPIDINAGVFLKRFGGSDDETARQVLTTSDGSYLILGENSAGNSWIFKLDKQGNKQNNWEYVSDSITQKLIGLSEVPDGYLGFGYSNNLPDKVGLVVKFDNDGILSGQKHITTLVA